MPNFTEISSDQLARLIGTPEAPTIVDVRTDEDFQRDPRLVPGAMRMPHEAAGAAELAGRVLAVCHRGLKLSHGVAALLRQRGIPAESLSGGAEAWAASGHPMIPAKAIPSSHVWVTRHRPKIDRIACPWLILRFIDPRARFLFVPPSEVVSVAERFDASPFDIEGAFWSHRAERCTLDTMIAEWQLSTPALDRVARIVRGADTNRHDLAPECAGLLALSVGLSRQYRSDEEQLSVGLRMYDALYRWARDGYEEGHDWPATRT